MANVFGIDLGTNNIKVYAKNEDHVLVQKNMIAIEGKTNLFAYGNSAYDMFEKTPPNIHISHPLNHGVIADIQNMEMLLKYFVNDASKSGVKQADFYIAVPSDITDVEKRAFLELVQDSGMKPHKVYGVQKAVADGLGLDIDVKNSQGVFVVNVGYATTEISILSLGGTVLSKLIKTGGFKFDEAIRNAVRQEFGLMIGSKTAEKVKVQLKELEEKGTGAVVYGRDIVTGLPVEREIPTTMIVKSLREHFDSIIDNIKVILERTPPELSADIFRHGIYLTGGASQVSHFAELVSEHTGLKVNVASEPMNSVVLGIEKIIKDDNYKSVANAFEGVSK